MAFKLIDYRLLGNIRSYLLEGGPTVLEKPFTAIVAGIPDIFETKDSSLLVFDLPKDILPPLPTEEMCRSRGLRVMPLADCKEVFAEIWEKTSEFESFFALFGVHKATPFSEAKSDIEYYIKSAPRLCIRVTKVIKHCVRFLNKADNTGFVMRKWGDGEYLLVVASPEFIALVRSLLLRLRVQAKADELDFHTGVWATIRNVE